MITLQVQKHQPSGKDAKSLQTSVHFCKKKMSSPQEKSGIGLRKSQSGFMIVLFYLHRITMPTTTTTRRAPSSPRKKTVSAKKTKTTGSMRQKEPLLQEEGSTKRKGALLIVESPAKAKTLKKYLGPGFVVEASVGHVKDLPKSQLGVDIEHDFAPEYEIIRGKAKVVAALKSAAKRAEKVYLAPDPDREGEAIAWHLAEEIRPANAHIQRVLFNEITKRGVTEAMAHPTELNAHKYDAQQTRRILDRLVGYQISPLLWNKVKRGLSAGRVQSVAVRLVVEREKEILAFVSTEYWTIEAQVAAKEPPPFPARLHKRDGKKLPIILGPEAQQIVADLKAVSWKVHRIETKERRKYPAAPFTTSKLQQEAAHKLRFSAKRTMTLAQKLYEGVDLGAEGWVGLITYMRTDSTRLSPDAIRDVRQYISHTYGTALLPREPHAYRSKGGAVQDAHEAIRPTSTKYDPAQVKKLLQDPRDGEDLAKLYQLIWNRFVACQMNPAVYDQTLVDIQAGPRYELRASGQVLKEPGFTLVYEESMERATKQKAEAEPEPEEGQAELPPLQEGESVRALKIEPKQHFTQPPPRFSEATLVKELEERGIGRPSTYATILSTIQDRGYVEKKESRFVPTVLGQKVNDLLVQSFPDVLDIAFTAQMEEKLDHIEEGSHSMKDLLKQFYKPFQQELSKAAVEMKNVKREEIPTDQVCEKCGKTMVIKWGRNGEFLACSGYPDCKNTKEFSRDTEGHVIAKTEPTTDVQCSACGSSMVVKRGRFGSFLACSRYPECKHTEPLHLGIACPKPGCGGMLVEKHSKKGAVFYGCTNYSKTKCDFVSWDRPVKETCPSCQAPFLLRKENRRGVVRYCQQCDYKQEEQMAEAATT